MRRLLMILTLALGLGWAQLCTASIIGTIGFSQGGGVITNSLTLSGSMSYNVDVYFTILTPNEIVTAYELAIKYTSTVLNEPTVTYSGTLGDPADYETMQTLPTITTDTVTLQEVSLLDDTGRWGPDDLIRLHQLQGTKAAPNTIQLANLKFTAATTAPATLSFAWSAQTDVKGSGAYNVSTHRTDPQKYDIIPEPSTYLLSLIAGATVVAAARFRSRKADIA